MIDKLYAGLVCNGGSGTSLGPDPTTISYFRAFRNGPGSHAEVEPSAGVYDWSAYRTAFDKADMQNQVVCARMPIDAHPEHSTYVPRWLAESLKIYATRNRPGQDGKRIAVPDYGSPAYIEIRKDLLRSFLKEFKDRKSFGLIDLLDIGFSSEGHTAQNGWRNGDFNITKEVRRLHHEATLEALKEFGLNSTHALYLINNGSEGVTWFLSKGGIRFRDDCIGHKTHMNSLNQFMNDIPGFEAALQKGGFWAEGCGSNVKQWFEPDNWLFEHIMRPYSQIFDILVRANCMQFWNMGQRWPHEISELQKGWKRLEASMLANYNNLVPWKSGVVDPIDPIDPTPDQTVTIVNGTITRIATVPSEDSKWEEAIGLSKYTIKSEHDARVWMIADSGEFPFRKWMIVDGFRVAPNYPTVIDGVFIPEDGDPESVETSIHTRLRGENISIEADFEAVEQPKPLPPNLLAPQNGEILDSKGVVFSWEPVDNVDAYELCYKYTDDVEPTITITQETSLAVTLIKQGTYNWTVKSFKNGEVSDPAPVQWFEVKVEVPVEEGEDLLGYVTDMEAVNTKWRERLT